MVNSRVEVPAVAVMGGGGGTAARSCAGCGGRIADRFLLFSMERYWHTRCLKCSCCHAQLGEYSSTCYSKGGMILCKNDYIRWALIIILVGCTVVLFYWKKQEILKIKGHDSVMLGQTSSNLKQLSEHNFSKQVATIMPLHLILLLFLIWAKEVCH